MNLKQPYEKYHTKSKDPLSFEQFNEILDIFNVEDHKTLPNFSKILTIDKILAKHVAGETDVAFPEHFDLVWQILSLPSIATIEEAYDLYLRKCLEI